MQSTSKDSSAARVMEPQPSPQGDALSASPKDREATSSNEFTSLTGGGGQHEFQWFLKRCEHQLREAGFVTIWTAADSKARRPAFAYTVGLQAGFRMPELIAFGLEENQALTVINSLVRQYHRRGVLLPLDQPIQVQQLQLAVKAIPTERVFPYAHRAIEYCLYKRVPCGFQQLVSPDIRGRFPWQRGYDLRMNAIQPQLFRP